MIKAVFFDLDGTLISDSTGKIPKSASNAVDQLRKNGVKIFTATGRHISEIRDLPANDIKFDGYITLNGQLCLDSREELLYSVPISSADVKQILHVFEEGHVPVMLVEKDKMYISFIDEKVRTAQAAIHTPVPDIGIYSGEPVYQCNLFTDEKTAEDIVARLTDCKMSRWNPYAVDIISKSGGKVAGIRQIMRHYGIQQNETMAFGDGENDMEMLRYVGIGVAMGNADREVKECADYITEHVDADGVEHALKHYNII